jgi:hypothetical protein
MRADSGGGMTAAEVYLHVTPRRRRGVWVVYQITEGSPGADLVRGRRVPRRRAGSTRTQRLPAALR